MLIPHVKPGHFFCHVGWNAIKNGWTRVVGGKKKNGGRGGDHLQLFCRVIVFVPLLQNGVLDYPLSVCPLKKID